MIPTKNKARIMSVLVILAMLFSFANVSPAAAACASSGSPTVTTDKSVYGPFETVTISGSGFGCGEVLSVLVTAPDGSTLSGGGTGSAGPDSVTTDENGAFVLSYHLSGTLPGGGEYAGQDGNYTVAVMNSSGAVLASTAFSDDGETYHTCAVTTSGGAKCWGRNRYGQLGNGTFSVYGSATPVDVSGLTSGVAQISTGQRHTCAVTTSGGAKCWGYNGFGGLGNGALSDSATPVNVSGLTSGVAQMSVGHFYTCAVTTSGGAKCWGYNAYGMLGNGTFSNSATPVDVSGLTSGVAQISAGDFHACALTTSGGVKCWGHGGEGQLGNGTFYNSATPVNVSGLTSGVAQISAGYYHTCAVMASGGVKCWGSNVYGGLGDGTFNNSRTTPVNVSGLTSGVAQISAGLHYTCAVTTSGGAKCWGYNINGQLGDGTVSNRATPVDVSGLTSGVAQISANAFHTCALTTSGGAKCWGSNVYGQLGDGTFSSRPTPVNVSGLTSGVALLPDVSGGVSNQPPTASAGGPYNVTEGSALAMSGASASDPNPADTLTYTWSVNSALCSFSNANALNPNLTCSDNGNFTATLAVSDGTETVSSDAAVTVNNVAPTASLGNNGPIDEGGSANVSFSGAFDPSSDDTLAGFHYAFDCNGGSLAAATYAASGTSDSSSCGFADNGSYTVSGKIMDKDDGFTTYQATVVVNNVAPTVGAITAPMDPQPVNTTVNVSAGFTDPGTLDTHTAVWNWGDGSTSAGVVSETNGSGSVSGSHSYSTPGVYTVQVTVSDDDGGSGVSVFMFVVVFDPNAGFVTGSGWIDSPAGACPVFCGGATGRAIFGFVSKYQPGANVPSGRTQFRFHAGGLNFESTSYEWLVVAGPHAKFKGSGTINGGGSYQFMVTATDGQVSGGGGVDGFRIKIWDAGGVIYDNKVGEGDDSNNTQAIGAGSIVIHN